MLKCAILVTALSVVALDAAAEAPPSIIADGPPEIPESLIQDTSPYLQYRQSRFQSWNPSTKGVLIKTRFGETDQLHLVRSPGGRREQLTFEVEPIWAGGYSPDVTAPLLLAAKDSGGGERFQIYRVDEGAFHQLTPGEGRNTDLIFSRGGRYIGYSSTRRTGKDADLWVMDPRNPGTDRMVAKLDGPGWRFMDFTPNGKGAVVQEYVSSSNSRLYFLNLQTGKLRLLLGEGARGYYGPAKFVSNRRFYYLSDANSEFKRLFVYDIQTEQREVISNLDGADVESFDVAPDGSFLAFSINVNGASRLYTLQKGARRPDVVDGLPAGVVSDLQIAPWGEIGFTLRSARSPADTYSVDGDGANIKRWTYSETGGVPHVAFVEPELVTAESFDGVGISGYLYRPDPKRHEGPRPAILMIHGGPAAQSRPVHLGRDNYLVNELGIALFYPNVRGSTGYGKRFEKLDDGFRREDALKDIGVFIDYLSNDPLIQSDRIGVSGGSYGGYLALASMLVYGDKLRAGHEQSGISHFVNFLENTEAYRRDLRRAEYGDERDPEMRAFLDRISPLSRASGIDDPLFVVGGANDPRVPISESEQIVAAIRGAGGTVWRLVATDEGHGFRKKANRDYHFWTMVSFWKMFLLEDDAASATGPDFGR